METSPLAGLFFRLKLHFIPLFLNIYDKKFIKDATLGDVQWSSAVKRLVTWRVEKPLPDGARRQSSSSSR